MGSRVVRRLAGVTRSSHLFVRLQVSFSMCSAVIFGKLLHDVGFFPLVDVLCPSATSYAISERCIIYKAGYYKLSAIFVFTYVDRRCARATCARAT